MEDDGMDEGGRWSSYPGQDYDRRIQSRFRDYDPYDGFDRHSARDGHYDDDGGPYSRFPPSMRNFPRDQMMAGRRMSRPYPGASYGPPRREGPNWILVFGGAIITAIGVVIVRRYKPAPPQPPPPNPVVSRRAASGKDRVQQSGLSFASTRRESTGSRTSELSTDRDPYMSAHTQPQSRSESSRIGAERADDECNSASPPAAYYSEPSKRSSHSHRIVITPTSPPGSYRGADTSATECNDLASPAQIDQMEFIPAQDFHSQRDTLQMLRQQLKSRDEMILSMQAQISDQENAISETKSGSKELEARLEEADNTLRESNLEIQKLRKAVADFLSSHSVPPLVTASPSAASDKRGVAKKLQRMDDDFLAKEAERLAGELKVREDEKQELKELAELRMKEHELVLQKLQLLESELEVARNSDVSKDLLLEAYEVEQENLEDKLDSLTRLVEERSPERALTSSKIGRRSLSGALGIFKLGFGKKSGSSESRRNSSAEDVRAQSKRHVPSYLSPERQAIKDSGRVTKGRRKTDESSSAGGISDESDSEEFSPAISEKIVRKLRQEVEQLSSILADHSDVIYEKRMETSRLVDEFQKHNALINDIQKKIDDDDVDITPDSQEQLWANDCQYLSFSTDSPSASQVQELSHKLEQIAKQQRVEEEIADLSKHQVKIAELKRRVEKVLKKCQNLQDGKGSLGTATQQHAGKMAASLLELAKQLNLQEEKARRTSREVQRLSASFQLTSPYVPRSKKEELRKMLQGCSSESSSPPPDVGPPDATSMFHLLSALQSSVTIGRDDKAPRDVEVSTDRAVTSAAQPPPRYTFQEDQFQRQQLSSSPGYAAPSTRLGIKPRRGVQRSSSESSYQQQEQSPDRGKPRVARRIDGDGFGGESKKETKFWGNDGDERADGFGGKSKKETKFWVKNRDGRAVERVSTEFPKRYGQERSAGAAVKDNSTMHRRNYSAPSNVTHNSVAEQSKRGHSLKSDPILRYNPSFASTSSPASRRWQSLDRLSDDSPTMRMGSPTSDSCVNVVHDRGNKAVERSRSSFGSFLFDMNTGNPLSATKDYESKKEFNPLDPSTPPLSPRTKISSGFPPHDLSSASGDQDVSPPGDVLAALTTTKSFGDLRHTRSTASGSGVSLDSSFDAMLDNALDDMVRFCSPPGTPPPDARGSPVAPNFRKSPGGGLP